MNTLEHIGRHKLIAVIRLDDLKHADKLCEALIAGGIRIIEFTLTNPEAVDVMGTVAEIFPRVATGEVILGAGTVLSVDDAQRCIDAGAQFIVSPVTDTAVIDHCVKQNVVAIPGALTPTEMWTAHDAGAQLVKLYPAPTVGPEYIRTVLQPMPFLKLVPSGGITHETIHRYLDAGAYAVGLTGALINKSLVDKQRWDDLREWTAEFVSKV